MAKTELWVPIIGSGTDGDPFRPDVPDDVDWAAEIPSELDPASPHYGRPAVKHARVCVAAEAAARIKAAVPADKVADEDRLLVEMCRLVQRREDKAFTPEAVSAIVGVFLREKARGQNAPGRAMLGRLLVHMTRRGLPEASARAIAQQVGML